jgi:hypothetical protein
MMKDANSHLLWVFVGTNRAPRLALAGIKPTDELNFWFGP